jgi:hypothetical protein
MLGLTPSDSDSGFRLRPDAWVEHVTALETAGQQSLVISQALEVDSLCSCLIDSGCNWALSTESVSS